MDLKHVAHFCRQVQLAGLEQSAVRGTRDHQNLFHASAWKVVIAESDIDGAICTDELVLVGGAASVGLVATLFAGAASLYGSGEAQFDTESLYPSYGAGLHYVIKPEERMLANLEYAHGNADNYGIYLNLGYSW